MRIRWLSLAVIACLWSAGCGNKTGPPSSLAPNAVTGGLTVQFLDVGQGDSALLQWSGHAALIDGGTPEAGATVVSDLRGAGVKRLDYVFASHPHADHIGGLPDVLDAFPVAHFVDSGFQTGSPQQVALLTAIGDHKIPFQIAKRGQTLDLGGGLTLRLLAPPDPFLSSTDSDANNDSIVARADFGGVKVLFTGDMEGAERRDLYAWLESQPDGANALRADVLKCAHHGSRNGTDAAFLRAVQPKVAVISCADGNRYGHPHAAALGALKQGGVELYRTDKHGDVTLTTDGKTVTMAPAHTATGDVWTTGKGRNRSRAARRPRRSRSLQPAY